MSKPTNVKRALRTTRWLPSPSSTLNKLERSGPWWRKLSKHSTTPERACGSFGHWWQSITCFHPCSTCHHPGCAYSWLRTKILCSEPHPHPSQEQAVIRTSRATSQGQPGAQKVRIPFWRGTGQMERGQAEKAVQVQVIMTYALDSVSQWLSSFDLVDVQIRFWWQFIYWNHLLKSALLLKCYFGITDHRDTILFWFEF